MRTRSDFARAVGALELSSVERAIAFLWLYRQARELDERTAAELAADIHEEGFAKPNATRLHRELQRSEFVVRGERERSFRVDVRQVDALHAKFGDLTDAPPVEVDDHVVPWSWVAGTRPYLESLVRQINGSYQFGFYDGAAALCRRLMESLIIDIYVSQRRPQSIQMNGRFLPLERLITIVCNDPDVTLGRNTPKTMNEIKALGDTAAHDRVYITEQMDIDEVRPRYRRMISELLNLAAVSKAA